MRNHVSLNLCERENTERYLNFTYNIEASSVTLAELLTLEDQQSLGTPVMLSVNNLCKRHVVGEEDQGCK